MNKNILEQIKELCQCAMTDEGDINHIDMDVAIDEINELVKKELSNG